MTKNEMRVLWGAGMVNPGFPYLWLKPHLRPIARSLRDRGYLRRKNFKAEMKPTARGVALLTKS